MKATCVVSGEIPADVDSLITIIYKSLSMSLSRGGYDSRWRASDGSPNKKGAFIAWGSGAWWRPRIGGDATAANPETPESGDPFLSRGDPFETPT